MLMIRLLLLVCFFFMALRCAAQGFALPVAGQTSRSGPLHTARLGYAARLYSGGRAEESRVTSGGRLLPPISTYKLLPDGPPPLHIRWSAEDLPVFCKIEQEAGKKLPVMVKFRLGSVEYVDWLEGKGDVFTPLR
jgi:hypothetical protein